ncbi:MAG: ATP phosphoribosyltransferase regulatory subunit [Alphaproteobacteria bacterium]|nr:ATP phosphoribosyltransferase regulatory subunit [Alphaproteobacteria bacterium]
MVAPLAFGQLPSGFDDLSPSHVRARNTIVGCIAAIMESNGFQYVEPPLVEYCSEANELVAERDNRLETIGKAVGDPPNGFTFFDPIARRQIRLRSDITPQIARIASTRLGDAPRPVRLRYDGAVVRRVSSALRPQRQFWQVGCETIGFDEQDIDQHARQIIHMAVQGLTDLGVEGITVDIAFPHLLETLLFRIPHALRSTVRAMVVERRLSHLERVDLVALRQSRELLPDDDRLLPAAQRAIAHIVALLSLPAHLPKVILALQHMGTAVTAEGDELGAQLHHWAGVLEALVPLETQCTFHVDALESRGFSYQSGLGFTLFAAGCRGSIGRGGHYHTAMGEQAMGFSLYADSLYHLPR